jgi:hypothetical protein
MAVSINRSHAVQHQPSLDSRASNTITLASSQTVQAECDDPLMTAVTFRLCLTSAWLKWDRHRRWRRTFGAPKLRALHAAAGRLNASIAAVGGTLQPSG